MKRFIIFTLIALFALSAFSCNTQPPQPSETTDGITTDSELTTDETTTEAEVTTDGETTGADHDYSSEELELLSQIYELTFGPRSDDIKINVIWDTLFRKYQADSMPLETSLKLGDRVWHLKYEHSEKYPLRMSALHKYSVLGGNNNLYESFSFYDDGSLFQATGSLVEFDLSNLSTLYDMIPMLQDTFREWVDLSEFPYVQIMYISRGYYFYFSEQGEAFSGRNCSIIMNKDGIVTSFAHQKLWSDVLCSVQDIDNSKEERMISLALREINRAKEHPYPFFTWDRKAVDKSLVSINGKSGYVRYIVDVTFGGEDEDLYTEQFDIIIPLDLLLEDSAAS